LLGKARRLSSIIRKKVITKSYSFFRILLAAERSKSFNQSTVIKIVLRMRNYSKKHPDHNNLSKGQGEQGSKPLTQSPIPVLILLKSESNLNLRLVCFERGMLDSSLPDTWTRLMIFVKNV
jgi:hypothetical protein